MVPARIRQEMTGNMLILTRGVDRCLWLFPTEEWKTISENLIGATSPFQEKARLIQRRILAPAQEAEFDRTGRIVIPQTLRDYAGLVKECVILGMVKYLEVWDAETYEQYLESTETDFREAAEELGGAIRFT